MAWARSCRNCCGSRKVCSLDALAPTAIIHDIQASRFFKIGLPATLQAGGSFARPPLVTSHNIKMAGFGLGLRNGAPAVENGHSAKPEIPPNPELAGGLQGAAMSPPVRETSPAKPDFLGAALRWRRWSRSVVPAWRAVVERWGVDRELCAVFNLEGKSAVRLVLRIEDGAQVVSVIWKGTQRGITTAREAQQWAENALRAVLRSEVGVGVREGQKRISEAVAGKFGLPGLIVDDSGRYVDCVDKSARLDGPHATRRGAAGRQAAACLPLHISPFCPPEPVETERPKSRKKASKSLPAEGQIYVENQDENGTGNLPGCVSRNQTLNPRIDRGQGQGAECGSRRRGQRVDRGNGRSAPLEAPGRPASVSIIYDIHASRSFTGCVQRYLNGVDHDGGKSEPPTAGGASTIDQRREIVLSNLRAKSRVSNLRANL